MKKPLKYRVWDVKLQRFVPKIDLDRDFGLNFCGELKCLMAPREDDEFVFQLYTGYQDKNGVDIFEGDILKNLVPSKYSPKKFTVEWGEFEPSDDMGVGGVGFVLPWFFCHFQPVVIGNIFQKPK